MNCFSLGRERLLPELKAKIVIYLLTILFFGVVLDRQIYPKNLTEEEQLIRVGMGAYTDGFYDIAEKQFSLFVRDYPNHGKVFDVCYLLGKSLIMKGKLKEAKAVFLKIVNEGKNFDYTDYALFWLAVLEMKLGNVEQSRNHLLTIMRRSPKFERIDHSYYLLGLLDFGSNRLAHAESSFKRAASLSKNNVLVRSSLFWLGIVSFKRKDYEAAVDYFQKVWQDAKFLPQEYLRYALFWLGEAQIKLGRFDEAKLNYKTFQERFKNDPLVPEAYWRLGFCEYRLGNPKESIKILQLFQDQFKNSPFLLYSRYLLGEIFLTSGDPSSSIKELNYIFNQPHGNFLWGVSFLILYWNYVHLGEIEESNRIIQKLQKLNHFEDEKIFVQWLNAELMFSAGKISDSLPYYFNLVNTKFREIALRQIGRGYFFENKFREAITNLDILLLEFPNSRYLEECLFIKGECLSQLGNLDSALETFDLIVKQKKSPIWSPLALSQSGNIYLSRNESALAETTFRKMIHDFPNHPLSSQAAFQLGNLYFKRKDMSEAFNYYSMVVKGNLSELSGEAYFALGEVFYHEGKYEKALRSFEAALQHVKGGSSWFFLTQLEIGNLQRRLGRYEEAKRSYRIILDQCKDEEIKRAARELLNHVESL
jgi:TolA-binding protein